MKWLGKINFNNRPQYDADGLITEAEVDTISGSLNTKISAKPDTLLELLDTPSVYDTGLYLKSTTSGTEWATASGGGVSNHSELNELDYASAGHTGFAEASHSHTESDISDLDKYTQNEVDTISGSLNTKIDGKSDTGHIHDDRYYTETELNNGQLDNRYYTETEVDTISGSLQTNIDGKSDTSHLHDDRYYTESEVDTISGSLNTKIDGKADTSHSHTESDISDLDKYTQGEVDTISGSLQTNIDGKADTVHTHDDRYYTESEIDTISGTLSSEIDSDISTHASNADAHHTESHTVASHSDTTATGAELETLTDGSDTSLHIHDSQYYTEVEVDTISGSLNTKIDGKDNYTSWSFAVDSITKDAITSSDVLDFVGGDNITITRSAEDQITISGTTGGGGLSNIVEDITPQLGGQLEVGEQDIKLDSSLSADEKYSGKTSDGVLGDTLAFGDLVYLNTTDQRWEKTDADTEATSGDVELAIVLAAGNDGDTRLLLKEGYVKDTSWTFTSYGQALFISVTAGTMTQTAPSDIGDIIRVVGKASTAQDQIYFKPSQTWLEVSSMGHEHTLLSLSDTPVAYDDNKYLKSTTSGTEWATVSGGTGVTDHSELSNLDYASAAHTGFQPAGDYATDAELTTLSGALQTNIDGKADTVHTHDDRYYTESELDAGQLDNRYYTESEVDTISGSLNTKIDTKMSDLSDDATPELSGQLGVGEYDIKLDALLSADGKYSGETFDGVLGATLAYGDLVYLNTTDQRWELADANAETTSGDVDLAIVLAGGDDGDTRLLLSKGFIREDDLNFTSYGQALYVSTTAGDMTQDVSGYTTGDIVRVVGHASTFADQINFKPGTVWVEIS